MTTLAGNAVIEDRRSGRRDARSSSKVSALEVGLFLPLLLATLPLGSISALPRALLAACLCAAAIVFLVYVLRGKETLCVPPGSIALLLFVVLSFLQLLPVGALMTASARGLVGGAIGPAEFSTPSLIPGRTLPRALECAALLALFIGSASVLSAAGRAERFALAFLVLGASLAAHGILVRAGAIPPLVDDQPRDVAVSVYFNRNHLAGLLELSILTGAGLLLGNRARRGSEELPLRVFGVFLLVLSVGGLLLTESRAGLAALAAGIVVLSLLRGWGRDRRLAVLAVVSVLICAAAVLWIAPPSLGRRISRVGDELSQVGTRPDIWLSGLRLALAFPFGTGLGSYGDLSPLTQTSGAGGRIEHAHCDGLEFLCESGVIGFLLLATATFVLGRRLWQRARSGGPADGRAILGCGAAAACLAIQVHGLVDFNFQIPANAAWTAALAGLAWACLGPRGDRIPGAAIARSGRGGLVAAALLLAVCGFLSLREALAAHLAAKGESSAPLEERIAWLARSNDVRPAAGGSSELAGRLLLERGKPEDRDKIVELARRALAANPFSAASRNLLGRGLLLQGELDAAGAAFDSGLRCTNPDDRPRFELSVATCFFAAGRLSEGLTRVRDCVARHEDLCDEAFAALYAQLPAYELIAAAVPKESKHGHERMAALLLAKGEFNGRESELAAARGERADPSRITVAPGVRLAGRRAEERTDGGRRVVRAELGFEFAGEPSPALTLQLCLEGPGAAVGAKLSPRGPEPVAVELPIDPLFPPGRYALVLRFESGAPPLPIASFTVPETVLDLLQSGAHSAAESLYWGTDPVWRRDRPVSGVPLRSGDVLWRRIRFTAVPSDLVVLCSEENAGISVTLDGRALAGNGATAARARRFATGDVTPGPHLLLIRAAEGTVPAVEKLLLLERGTR